jgi:pSer/pThr/pTyr-binding forkhead associated (FHA) protein
MVLESHGRWIRPRVFTVDGDPVLLNDGDVIVIGTQRHSVPKMPEVKDRLRPELI